MKKGNEVRITNGSVKEGEPSVGKIVEVLHAPHDGSHSYLVARVTGTPDDRQSGISVLECYPHQIEPTS